MAVQRIAAGSGDGPGSRLIIGLAETYESPMNFFCKVAVIKQVDAALTDFWCDLLEAPETTP